MTSRQDELRNMPRLTSRQAIVGALVLQRLTPNKIYKIERIHKRERFCDVSIIGDEAGFIFTMKIRKMRPATDQEIADMVARRIKGEDRYSYKVTGPLTPIHVLGHYNPVDVQMQLSPPPPPLYPKVYR